jgi:hypothetical protein
MAVLAVANEADSWEILAGGALTQTGAPLASGARSVLRVANTGRVLTRFSDISEGWIRIWWADNNNLNSLGQIYIKNNTSGKNQFRISWSGSSAAATVAWSADGITFTTLGSYTVNPSFTGYWLDYHFKLGASGIFEVFFEGALSARFTGSYITNDAVANGFEIFAGSTGQMFSMSSVIIADEPTLGWTLGSIAPSGVGTSTAWGGLFSDINDIGALNPLNFISTNTPSSMSTFAMTDMITFASATREIKDVWFHCSAEKTAVSTAVDIAPVIRTSGINYTGSAFGVLPSAGAVNFKKNYPLSPAGVAWTEALVNAVEAGFVAS